MRENYSLITRVRYERFVCGLSTVRHYLSLKKKCENIDRFVIRSIIAVFKIELKKKKRNVNPSPFQTNAGKIIKSVDTETCLCDRASFSKLQTANT